MFKLDHLIFIVQENRSFDHYFGTYPGADGFRFEDGEPAGCVPDPILGGASCVYHTSAERYKGGPHNRASAMAAINGGAMNGFVHALPRRAGGAPSARTPSARRSWVRTSNPTH